MSLGRVVQSKAGLLVPFHRLSGQGRAWVDFSRVTVLQSGVRVSAALSRLRKAVSWLQL